MQKILVEMDDELNFQEFKKIISFMSTSIIDFNLNNDVLEIQFQDSMDPNLMRKIINDNLNKFKSIATEEEMVIFEQMTKREYLGEDQLYSSGMVFKFSDGVIGLSKDAIKLYEFFDNKFKDIAMSIGAKEERYPVLLPLNTISNTGYLKTSPQYSMFCCNAKEDFEELTQLDKVCKNGEQIKEKISDPKFTLSPAACFHTYEHLRNQEIDREKIITFNQSVFRNEGRFNWGDFGRLRDYHVREIVFVGSADFVRKSRESVVSLSIKFLNEIGLNASLNVAYDPFVIPKMQKFKTIQVQERNKYELQVYYDENKSLAVASFNLHGDAFTLPFNIKVKGVDNAVTGCVGFGIERWVLAFIMQYGLDSSTWPSCIQI